MTARKEELMEKETEHESAYALMMDALDGDLSTQGALNAHLQQCVPCAREWHTLQAVDQLLRHAPIITPATDFAQRTIARLPNQRHRLWSLSALYVFLLIGGIIPLILIGFLAIRFAPLVMEPSMARVLWEPLVTIWGLAATVSNALLIAATGFIRQQPALWGIVLIMAGTIALSGEAYQRYMPIRQA
jgi:anti-sigma factor RsiW